MAGEKLFVYVSGPYTVGDVAVNVRRAIEKANLLMEFGFVPIVPHLSHLWHMIAPKKYEEWMAYDMQLLSKCDALYAMAGESIGRDLEVVEAERLGIPVFHNINKVLEWRQNLCSAVASQQGKEEVA